MTATRTVFIAGASSDIGLALCRRYLDAGWRVIGHFRTQRPELDAMRGERLETWQADLADTAALERSLAEKPEFFQRADALVNLAADVPVKRFEDANASDMLKAIAVNTLPGLLLMKVIGPAMAKRGFGRIVQASSIGVKFGGGSDSFLYSFSKHALEFIPKASREWVSRNVFVNAVRVGVTDTRLHKKVPGKDMAARARLIPTGRLATPKEVAEALFWFGSPANAFTTGQIVDVAGGE